MSSFAAAWNSGGSGAVIKYKSMSNEVMEMTEKGDTGGEGGGEPASTPPMRESQNLQEEVIVEEPEPGETTPALKKEGENAPAEEKTETPRKISFTKRRSKKKGRFSVKIAEPDVTPGGSEQDGSEDTPASPIRKVMRKVSTPMKGRFQVKTLREKPHRPSRVSTVENGQMSPGLEDSFDQAARNQMTVEAIPQLAYYRNQQTKSAVAKQRPTLRELHAPKVSSLMIIQFFF